MSALIEHLKLLVRPAPFNIAALLVLYHVPGQAQAAGLPVRKNGKPYIKPIAKRLKARYAVVLKVLKLVKNQGIEALNDLCWNTPKFLALLEDDDWEAAVKPSSIRTHFTLPLRVRAAKLTATTGKKITKDHMRSLYKAHRISFRKQRNRLS